MDCALDIDNTGSDSSPKAQYRRSLDVHLEEKRSLDKTDDRIATLRLFSAGLILVTLWLSLTHAGTAYLPAAVFAVFIALSVYHNVIAQKIDACNRLISFYEAGVARIEDRWSGKGNQGKQFLAPEHPYCVDLDIFGEGSLYELLCVARTHSGEERLAQWLSNASCAIDIRDRQAAVQELSPNLQLRIDMSVLGQKVRSKIQPEALRAWGEQPPILKHGPLQIIAWLITIGMIASGLTWLLLKVALPFYIASLIVCLYQSLTSSEIRKVTRSVHKTAHEFGFIADMLKRIEQEPFKAPLLMAIQQSLIRDNKTASQRLSLLTELVGYLDAQLNQLFAPIAFLLLWNVHWAYAIDRWRQRNGADIHVWITRAGEFEALLSLAGYAYEHPDLPYPEIVDDGPCFDAVGIRHPLIPRNIAVANNISFDNARRLYIISGSNMSGKSTLLRTLGTNAVLAMAGAPVCAGSLRYQPRVIGASIRTTDSLRGGISRFYAELLRLSQIIHLAKTTPTLCLLDEIMHGTNSHDRLIGSEAVVRALVESGAIGLVTTHDLALARIAGNNDFPAVNAHFEDQITDGVMTFDYKLRDGVVTRSNAIELMRTVGLEV